MVALFLLQGLTAPLLGSMAENAVLFSSFHTTKDLLPEGTHPHIKLLLGGAAAGIGVSFVLTPVELIKCKLQVENAVDAKYKGPFDCLKQVCCGLNRDQVSWVKLGPMFLSR